MRKEQIGLVTVGGVSLALVIAVAILRQRKQSTKRSSFQSQCQNENGPDPKTILNFWFEGDIKELFISRWFPDSRSSRQEIADKTIREQFGSILQLAEEGSLADWASDPYQMLALILVLDQFSRHVYRGAPNGELSVKRNDAMALKLTMDMIERGWDRALAVPHLCFALMPLRHSATVDKLQLVLSKIQLVMDVQEGHQDLLKKFRRATLRRLQDLQGQAAQQSGTTTTTTTTLEPDFDILEFHPFVADESDLHKHPLIASMTHFLRTHYRPEANNNTAVVSLSGGVDSMVITKLLVFLRDYYHQQQNQQQQQQQSDRPMRNKKEFRMKNENNTIKAEDGSANDTLTNNTEQATHDQQSKSLRKEAHQQHQLSKHGPQSGQRLRHARNDTVPNATIPIPQRIIAIHIDYGNRAESTAEADYVEWWCRSNNVEFHKRKIDEVKRGVTKRDEYEAISRDIRYSAYRNVLDGVGCEAVMFGHHQGDLQENVISNVMKGGGILDLAGMHECSIVNHVSIWRPLLAHPKSDIFHFAHKYGVPYFKDTTPKWSTRGKTRNHLVPLLEDVYGDGFLHNLSMLGEESTQLNALVQSAIFQPFYAKVKHSPAAAWVDCADYLNQPLFFWKEAFKHVCHSYLGESMIRDKPMIELIERLARPKRLDGWITLKKSSQSYVHGTTVILFRSSFMPPAESTTPTFPVGDVVCLDVETPTSTAATRKSTKLGLWTISLTQTEKAVTTSNFNSSNNSNSISSFQPRFEVSMWDILTGDICYDIENKPPFVVAVCNKNLKLARGMDKQMKDAVPFVVATGKQFADQDNCWVTVRLVFNAPQNSAEATVSASTTATMVTMADTTTAIITTANV